MDSSFALDPALDGAGSSKRATRPVQRHNMVSVDLALDPDELARERRRMAASDSEDGSEFEIDMGRQERIEPDEEISDETDAEEEYEQYIDQADQADQPSPSAGFSAASQTLSSKRKGKLRAIEPDLDLDEGDLETGPGFDRLLRVLQPGDDDLSTLPPAIEGLGPQWDQSIENELAEIDLEGTQGRRKKKGGGDGRRRQPQLSSEVQRLLGEANLAYVTAERDKAIEILQEVIRIEPGIIQPWITLATIHSELGDEEKALRFRVIAATLQPKDIDNWKDIARQSRQFGLLSQAIYCYTQASRADRDDVDALWDRAYLHREMGNYRRSAATLKQILRILPHDPFIVRNLMSDYIKASNIQEACAVGQACLSFQRYDQPHGPARNANESAYTLEDLYTLSTLQNGLHRYADAIRTVKTGVRWMQGREDEVWWDSHPDDREYDVERTEDRMPPPERADATATHALDTRLRLVLGQARLAGTFKDKQEAKRHFDTIQRQLSVEETPEMFGDIADAYFDRKHYEEAAEVFQVMADCDTISSTMIWIKIGQCYRRIGKLEEAITIYDAIIVSDESDLDSKLALAELYEATGKRDAALKLVNDVISRRGEQGMDEGDLRNFFAKQRQLTKHRQQRLDGGNAGLSKAQRAEMERELQDDVERAIVLLDEREAAVQAGDEMATREWMDIAGFLIDNFREAKALFPHDASAVGKYRASATRLSRADAAGEAPDIDAQANDLVSRIQRSMVQDQSTGETERLDDTEPEGESFRGLPFDQWLTLAIKYAFVLTKMGDEAEAVEALQHLQTSMLRLNPQRMLSLRLAIVSIGIHNRNYTLAIDEVRKFLLAYPYQNAPLRLMQAITPHGIVASSVAASSNHQKFVMRQMKLIADLAVKQEERNKDREGSQPDEQPLTAGGTGGGAGSRPRSRSATAAPSSGEFVPTRRNPAFIAQYGTLMSGSRSFQASLIYFLRAYELAPNDPIICLQLGIGYFHRAMQRQSDNRHHQVSQGLAFFGRYRKLRGPCQEVEYNLGRAYHSIGLVDSAIKQYEKVLEMETERRLGQMTLDDDADDPTPFDSFACEAAYNLQLVYMTTNNRDLARQVAKQWLTL